MSNKCFGDCWKTTYQRHRRSITHFRMDVFSNTLRSNSPTLSINCIQFLQLRRQYKGSWLNYCSKRHKGRQQSYNSDFDISKASKLGPDDPTCSQTITRGKDNYVKGVPVTCSDKPVKMLKYKKLDLTGEL